MLLSKDRSTIYEAFHVLEKQKIIHKFHDKTYRLRGRPAIYCLAKDGIRYLRQNTEMNDATLRNYYKNPKMDEEYIDKCLNILILCLKLISIYGDSFDICTKWQLNKDIFPSPPPELWLKRKQAVSGELDYVLDIFPAFTPTWLLKRRLRQYQDFEDDSEYESTHVLLVAQNESTERRLFKLTENTIQDFEFYITQQDLLLNSQDGAIWIDLMESDEDEFVRVGLK